MFYTNTRLKEIYGWRWYKDDRKQGGIYFQMELVKKKEKKE